jgi:hypothetical protein
MEYVERYIKHDRSVHTLRQERDKEAIDVEIWIANKHLHIQYPNKIKLTPTVVISDDNRALTIMECHVEGHKTESYQVKRKGNIIKIPAKYARCRQRAYSKKIVPANLLTLDPAYAPTINKDMDLGTYKLVIDRKYIP